MSLQSIRVRAGESVVCAVKSPSSFVDELPGCCQDIASILIDYLRTECGVAVPAAHSNDDLPTLRAMTSLNLHEAKVLRTRLGKRKCMTLAEILKLYGRTGSGEHEWVNYLRRQVQHFESESDRIVIVAVASGGDGPDGNQRGSLLPQYLPGQDCFPQTIGILREKKV